MKLVYKEIQTPYDVRSMYVAVPDSDPLAIWKSPGITILREDAGEASVKALLSESGFDRMCDEHKFIIQFPNPTDAGWNYTLDPNGPKDAELIIGLNANLNNGNLTEGWRSLHDVHYLVGIGSGASLVNTAAALFPSCSLAAAIITIGGELSDAITDRLTNVPIPALIASGDPKAVDYFIKANEAVPAGDGLWACSYNPLQKVAVSNEKTFSAALAQRAWQEFIRLIRRTNTSPEGDTDRRIIPEECGFNWHINDTQLGDNNGLGHDWLEAVPESVKKNPDKKVPLFIFGHGMSDNPLKAADMIKMHEIGEREGFITIYPFSSNRYSWNLSLDPEQYDDIAYYDALIAYAKRTYPIDESRVYISGFSNGAGQSMNYALLRPNIIAAACPVDSTWPYAALRMMPANIGGSAPARPRPAVAPVGDSGTEIPMIGGPNRRDPSRNLIAINIALENQKTKEYRMPVMYFYGTREMEYPIGKGSNQELNFISWKKFNNITNKETVENLKPDAVGVAGDKITTLYPTPEHPKHFYTHHAYYSNDAEPKNYYNIMLMHGKAHDVHPAERELGWAFVSRFSRNPDGSLNDARPE